MSQPDQRRPSAEGANAPSEGSARSGESAGLVRPIRVLLVDDDALVRRLLATVLRADGIEVVGEASDGDEVVPQVQAHHPDVVLMDIRMERMNGIEATRAVRALAYPPGVVALTSFDTRALIVDVVAAGAVGFLAKDSSPQEISGAVRQVASGEGALSPRAARVMVESVQATGRDAQQLAAQRLIAGLTERELEVARGVARGLANDQLAAALHLSVATVKTYLTQAIAKVGVTNRVQLAVVMTQAGENPVGGDPSDSRGRPRERRASLH